MEKKYAEDEMKYRLIKTLLATMLEEGIISEAEFTNATQKLVGKLKPIIGQLE